MRGGGTVRLGLGLALVAANGARVGVVALECFTGTQDCFPECQELHVSELQADGGGEAEALASAALLDLSGCAFVPHETLEDDFAWQCNRTFAACSSKADCKAGITPSQTETCAPDQTFCVDHYRKPQNSRYGKTAVWGFEAVHVRGCASSCVSQNASMDTGVGIKCCTEDLCNSSSRLGGTTLLLAMTAALLLTSLLLN